MGSHFFFFCNLRDLGFDVPGDSLCGGKHTATVCGGHPARSVGNNSAAVVHCEESSAHGGTNTHERGDWHFVLSGRARTVALGGKTRAFGAGFAAGGDGANLGIFSFGFVVETVAL